jgi:histone acetyltransferase SAS3
LRLLNFFIDAEQWRCPGCVSNALQPDTVNEDVATVASGRRSSVPKLARDLLPSQRGAIKPDSHSVFNHLIVDDDPMDGSRLLRKRKTSSIEPEDRIISPTRKRRKVGSNGSTNLNVVESEIPGNNRIHFPVDDGVAETSGKGDVAEPVTPRIGRSLRIKAVAPSHAKIIKSTRTSLVISLSLDKLALATILYTVPKPKKKRSRPPTAARRESISAAPPPYIPHTYSQPFYSFHDREMDESKGKPYGGILNEAEGDTSKTVPQPDDRRRFDDARQRAEEEWKVKTAIAQAEAETIRKPRKVSGPASQIECINFGGFEIDTWYAAPYPEEYSRNRVLFICEFCLKYMNSEYVAWRHKMKCPSKHPPGDEIYRDGSVSVFEVDGRKNPVYCQNLCLLAKLFLGSKTLYYDVEPFLFYVMTEYDELGCHFVGYFSKEKRPSSQNNVSCILTLPIHQRKGYGNLLIDFSYLLTRVEKKSGSPEKPLSDMGLVSYRNYWRLVLCYELRNQKTPFSIIELSERTGMTADDIVSALEGLRALVRDPETRTYALRLDYDFFNEYIKKWENKKYVRLNPNGLVWTPYIQKHNNQNTIDNGPSLNTMAQRDEDDDEVHPLQEDKQNLVVNGESKNAPNGMKNGAGGKGDTGEVEDIVGKRSIDAMDIDSPEININGKGGGKGPIPTIESSLSPTSTRFRVVLSSTPAVNGNKAGLSIDVPAANIPPSRFEVFPPVPGLRGLGKPRLSVSRPIRPASTPRTTSARPSASRRNSSRRSTGSKPRSSARRSSGATGRGPGRWPKGTKKSDFGNADSGPGLPPKLKTRSRLGVEVKLGDERSDDDIESEAEEKIEEDEDAILFEETPAPSRRRNGTRGTESTRSSRSKGKGKAIVDEDDDSEDAEPITGDVDAEGEDE